MLLKKKLTNFQVIEKTDKNGKPYFIIFDNDNQGGNNAYFVWDEDLKNSLKNWQSWKEVEIEWEEKEKGNKVVGIYPDTEIGDIFI